MTKRKRENGDEDLNRALSAGGSRFTAALASFHGGANPLQPSGHHAAYPMVQPPPASSSSQYYYSHQAPYNPQYAMYPPNSSQQQYYHRLSPQINQQSDGRQNSMMISAPHYHPSQMGYPAPPVIGSIQQFDDSHFLVCAKSGHWSIVQDMVEFGANVHARDQHSFTAMHYACGASDCQASLSIVKLLVQNGANPNATNHEGLTPLMLASEYGYLEIVQFLIQKFGASLLLNAQNKHGWTALHWAASEGHLEIVKVLVQHGANMDATDQKKETPLYLACSFDQVEIAKFLIKKGANGSIQNTKRRTPLHVACGQGHLELIQLLLQLGNKLYKDQNGNTPLQDICQYEHVHRNCDHPKLTSEQLLEVAKVLIGHGADLNVKNREKQTLLQDACQSESVDMVKLLVENGCDIHSSRNVDGWALRWACELCYLEIVKLLMKKHPVAFNLMYDNGETPLHWIFLSGRLGARAKYTPEMARDCVGIVKLLIGNGVNLNAQLKKNGKTPLHLACEKDFMEEAMVLIENGADLEVKDRKGNAALHLMVYNYHLREDYFGLHEERRRSDQERRLEAIKFLIETGRANLNAAGNGGRTALHLVCEFPRRLKVAKLLVEHGANIDSQEDDGKTPLHVACEKGYLAMVKLLLDQGAKLNEKSKQGHTPLHVASKENHLELVWLLVHQHPLLVISN